MDFSRLPEPAFLNIFKYLRLDDIVRASGVNKTFRQIAQLVISRRKSLNLTNILYEYLTPDQLAVLLDLCSPNLERIKLGDIFISDNFWQEMVATFADFECPRMIDIDLGEISINRAVFDQLVRNCPNMASLEWRKDFVGFPAITNNKLKKMRLNVSSNASLRTLIDRCPNLEELHLDAGNEITAGVLDQFFASVPRTQRIRIDLEMDPIEFEEAEMVNFYRLPLTKLIIIFESDTDDSAGDDLLYKVARSFPHLRELDLSADLSPTSQGIASLSTLRELQVLNLDLSENGEPYDQGFHRLAHCSNLRHLIVSKSIMAGGTLVHLLRYCPQLEFVDLCYITEVESPEEAAVVLGSLTSIRKRDIIIRFNEKSENFESIWRGELVMAAIKKLEEDDGLKIRIG